MARSKQQGRLKMKQITISSANGRESYDIEALEIDNTLAHKLSREDLYRRLVKLKVGCKVTDGGQDLLVAYARHLAAQPKQPPVHRRAVP
jgi:hypothetical protein